MTKEEAKELAEILLAYSEGKTIQYFSNNDWNDLNVLSDCFLNESMNGFIRIKPEKKLVPFTFEDIDLFKDKWISLCTSSAIFKINSINRKGVSVSCSNGNQSISYDQLLENYTFEDCSPCGKYIEE